MSSPAVLAIGFCLHTKRLGRELAASDAYEG